MIRNKFHIEIQNIKYLLCILFIYYILLCLALIQVVFMSLISITVNKFKPIVNGEVSVSVIRPGGRYSGAGGEDDVRPETEGNGTSHIRGPEKEGNPRQVSH